MGPIGEGVLGLVTQKLNDQRQLKQQGKLGEQQLGFDIRRMGAQNDMGYSMWKKTGPVGQVEQLKEAGLGIGLMYGGSGPGGQTVGNASGGLNAPSAPAGGNEIMGMQLLQAQRALIEAQTDKTKVEAEKIGGVDTKEAATRIESLTQGITNQKANARLTDLQGDIAEIEGMIKTGSAEDVMATIRYTSRKTMQELQALEMNNEITTATKEDKIAIVQGELIGLGLANEMKKVGIEQTEQQIKESVARVSQGWKSLSIQDKNAITNMLNAETARTNANTNIREFLESVRKTDYDYDVRNGMLQLQRFIHDVPETTKMTVGAMTQVFGTLVNATTPKTVIKK